MVGNHLGEERFNLIESIWGRENLIDGNHLGRKDLIGGNHLGREILIG